MSDIRRPAPPPHPRPLGNSLRQTVHTHRASVHQAAKLVAALLRVAGLTAGLAESNGSLTLGLWLMLPAGWLPRTRNSSGTLRSVIVIRHFRSVTVTVLSTVQLCSWNLHYSWTMLSFWTSSMFVNLARMMQTWCSMDYRQEKVHPLWRSHTSWDLNGLLRTLAFCASHPMVGGIKRYHDLSPMMHLPTL